jgi:hypothetical protein
VSVGHAARDRCGIEVNRTVHVHDGSERNLHSTRLDGGVDENEWYRKKSPLDSMEGYVRIDANERDLDSTRLESNRCNNWGIIVKVFDKVIGRVQSPNIPHSHTHSSVSKAYQRPDPLVGHHPCLSF